MNGWRCCAIARPRLPIALGEAPRGRHEIEREAGAALMAAPPGVELTPFHLE
jgi:hypothetical protein